jgi:hypothetical protein
MTVPSAVVLLSVSLLFAIGPLQRADQSDTITTIDDLEAPPSSLEELWAESAIVARVRIETSTPQVRGAGILSSVATHHTAVLLEVLKDDEHRKPGSRIGILRPGGEATHKGRKYRTIVSVFDILEPGQELILFLSESRQQPLGPFVIPAGPAGAYLVENDSVIVPEHARRHMPVFRERHRMPTAEFLARLRMLGVNTP